YPFPHKRQQLVRALERQLRNGSLDDMGDRGEVARALTEELIRVTGDLHFLVGVDPDWIRDQREAERPKRAKELEREEVARLRRGNFGFNQVKRLEGNVGYLRFDCFADPEHGAKTAAAALGMLENVDALIFDLRYNNGGYLEMAQFLMSYLFAPTKEERLFFDCFYRQDGKRVERGQWLLPSVPGKRLAETPVYVVTSCTTFSAAEWFSYVLQKLGRAKIVGERTAGAAHPVERKALDDYFFLQTPIGEMRDPVDGTDFEGRGVQPDLSAIAESALAVAHKDVFELLVRGEPSRKSDYDWFAPILNARIKPLSLPRAKLIEMVGNYEGRRISLRDGKLRYHWRERFELGLTPLSTTLFALEGIDEFRFEAVFQHGKVTGLRRVERDGSSRVYRKENI
ncbi:MAG: S41 family peptidase, partial [Myxococcota bacterium]